MKVSILVILIVIPMLASIGLYCYSFISTRWSRIDENLIQHYSSRKGPQRLQTNINSNNNIQFDLQTIRHAFRSRYGLFGYCLDYKWINLLTIKPQPTYQYGAQTPSTLFCERCNQTLRICTETGCCMTRCDNIPDCPTYIDEKDCTRQYSQKRYYWPKGNCMWQSTWIGDQALPRYLSTYRNSPKDFHYYVKRIRYYIMFLLFIAAPILTFLALLIIFCTNCVKRFYSIPFAFVSIFSLASFLCGAGALGIFLYEWIQERLHRPDFTYELNQAEALVVALNPWLIEVERLGLAFWLTVAAIATTLFTTILSCCFCCGLQSEKSKLRFRIDNDTYEIVHMPTYDD
ncbi:unnamed protein product [Rotaria sordida]|uniref:Uncharacterized protein n=1 Tax=Rotaria sordida TaxID=392033 RepID=A0A814FLK3_9BILA|nr:unnamed protein product [Rotaria sordida]CAF0982759.1 unnamed protein product [Rotaria sordida]CAF0983633.1 unnamed protein product [Rotaria sordida]CAF1191094.1 unnamed protein product [Rotaria sordida]CAF1192536.1 unnamed protein product [Rotaria sordida]